MEVNMVGEGEDAGNTKAGSLPSTVLSTHSSQTGERDADRVDSHTSYSSLSCRPQVLRHQQQQQCRHIPNITVSPDQNAATTDTDTACNLHKNEKPTTITFTDPMANPSELDALMHSARQL
jgi:hypothetical protein